MKKVLFSLMMAGPTTLLLGSCELPEYVSPVSDVLQVGMFLTLVFLGMQLFMAHTAFKSTISMVMAILFLLYAFFTFRSDTQLIERYKTSDNPDCKIKAYCYGFVSLDALNLYDNNTNSTGANHFLYNFYKNDSSITNKDYNNKAAKEYFELFLEQGDKEILKSYSLIDVNVSEKISDGCINDGCRIIHKSSNFYIREDAKQEISKEDALRMIGDFLNNEKKRRKAVDSWNSKNE